MSFVQPQRSLARHSAGIAAAVVLHIVLVWALMNGLAHKVMQVINSPIETKIIEEVKPSPAPPKVIELPPPPKFALPPPTAYAPPPEVEVQVPAEAKRVIEAGYTTGKFGTGADAERHKRLRDLANKQTAEDENGLSADVIGRGAEALVTTGYALVTIGRTDKGIALMEQGVSKGGLKRPDDARLHLAQAYLLSGNKAKAVEAFRTVRGSDGAADLARLWMILARQS